MNRRVPTCQPPPARRMVIAKAIPQRMRLTMQPEIRAPMIELSLCPMSRPRGIAKAKTRSRAATMKVAISGRTSGGRGSPEAPESSLHESLISPSRPGPPGAPPAPKGVKAGDGGGSRGLLAPPFPLPPIALLLAVHPARAAGEMADIDRAERGRPGPRHRPAVAGQVDRAFRLEAAVAVRIGEHAEPGRIAGVADRADRRLAARDPIADRDRAAGLGRRAVEPLVLVA